MARKIAAPARMPPAPPVAKPAAPRQPAQPGQNAEEPRAQGGKLRRHRATPDGAAPFTPLRGAFSGKGKEKRNVVSTTGQSRRRGGRARNNTLLPPAAGGTG